MRALDHGGGMITANSDDVASKVRILRDQGKESFHGMRVRAFQYYWQGM